MVEDESWVNDGVFQLHLPPATALIFISPTETLPGKHLNRGRGFGAGCIHTPAEATVRRPTSYESEGTGTWQNGSDPAVRKQWSRCVAARNQGYSQARSRRSELKGGLV